MSWNYDSTGFPVEAEEFEGHGVTLEAPFCPLYRIYDQATNTIALSFSPYLAFHQQKQLKQQMIEWLEGVA